MLEPNIITTYGHHNTKSVIVKGPHSPSKTHSLRSGSLASNHRIPGNLLLSAQPPPFLDTRMALA